jgi:ribosomal protein L37E
MLKSIFGKPKSAESTKCIKCGSKDATKQDQLCDSCRYMLVMENIVQSRK